MVMIVWCRSLLHRSFFVYMQHSDVALPNLYPGWRYHGICLSLDILWYISSKLMEYLLPTLHMSWKFIIILMCVRCKSQITYVAWNRMMSFWNVHHTCPRECWVSNKICLEPLRMFIDTFNSEILWWPSLHCHRVYIFTLYVLANGGCAVTPL